MAIRALLRTVMHYFISTDRRDGPYLLQLTDFHQSNIFVDDDWNLTCLIDLEWICALPVDMLSVPYWLTDCSIDGIIDDEYGVFDEARQAFLAIMDEEARRIPAEHDIDITSTMRHAWESKGVWFWACLRSINAWLFVFEDHILPKFSADKGLIGDLKQVSTFWHEQAEPVVRAKVDDEERYQAELRSLFNREEASRSERNRPSLDDECAPSIPYLHHLASGVSLALSVGQSMTPRGCLGRFLYPSKFRIEAFSD